MLLDNGYITLNFMEKISCRIFDSAAKIPKNDWDRVFGDIPEGYQFYRTIDDSRLGEFSFFYLTLFCGNRLVLIAPLFIADFSLDIAVDGWLEKAIAGIRKVFPGFLIMRTLFCGSPFGERGVIGIDKEVVELDRIREELLKGLEAFRKQNNASLTVFKDFLSEQTEFLDPLSKNGFFRVSSFPTAVCNVKFNNFEEYLMSLGSSTRKNLRRKLKDAHNRAKIKVIESDNVGNIIEDIYGLYLHTHYVGATKFEKLTKEFFLNAAEYMKPRVKYFLYYADDRLVAFNLCFVYEGLFIDKFIGFDYDLSTKLNLYFVSWCYNIDWCIRNRISSYQTGQTDYGAKIRLGSRLIPLYAYARYKHKIGNLLFKVLAMALKPGNFDEDIPDNQPES